MPKVSDEHRLARRDQITRAAMGQFVLRGIHLTSTDNIAQAAGLSAGAIYTHFANKDEIIAYVARTAVEGVFAGLEQALDHDPLLSPKELVALIAERIPQAGAPIEFMVQVWGEAVTNRTLRELVNEVYAKAFERLREYATLWFATAEEMDVRQARIHSSYKARQLLSMIYAHILQLSLIEGYEAPTLP
ncbi:TetR/AcrR family transcriptional regulator [Brevibacterium aurantiacum]|uniref:TetR/AcrR family transcriptional regulator n=1 Tax=Brevibacterium aurantiacum TaxID=273384 RepID=A0A4Z0KJ86_BREAU|nr:MULTISPECIES: TetR/AcrR family transcriptional regulator [Brevibacterium]TGD38872.1 TetR/AcrR family transcriptional regulator [Brevibacterium aurantiacum]